MKAMERYLSLIQDVESDGPAPNANGRSARSGLSRD